MGKRKKIYHIKLIEPPGYEVFSEFVVIASNKEEARQLCHISDDSWPHENKEIWINKSKSTCKILGKSNISESQVIVKNFTGG